jgi:hypothetical protein
MPHEYLFITKDNKKTRIGEFVYYTAQDGEAERQIIGTIKGRKLVRNLPDAFLSDPNTPPALVSSFDWFRRRRVRDLRDYGRDNRLFRYDRQGF